MTEILPNENDRASGSDKALVKKLYQKPVLTRMGALRDVTMAKGSGKVSDGSKSSRFHLTGRGGLQSAEG